MGRLETKNILVIIPKDYYNEKELNPILEILKSEQPENLRVASAKLREAVGMKNGRVMPDLLIVDAMEGITGDSYVTGGRGSRQVKGIFHGTIVVGGNGAKRYLWDDAILRLLLTDRHRSGFVVAAIGLGVPCLGSARLLEGLSATMEANKNAAEEFEKARALLVDEDLVVNDRIITARDATVVKPFVEAFIEAVRATPLK